MYVTDAARPRRSLRARMALKMLVAAGTLALVVTGCGDDQPSYRASSPPSASASDGRTASASQPASSSQPASITAATTPAATVPPTDYAARTFHSPSGRISCEFNTAEKPSGEIYCQIEDPPRSVSMDATGALSECRGLTCLGNPGEGTPALTYGSTRTLGAFTCASATNGITCTVHGRGFRIANDGVSKV